MKNYYNNNNKSKKNISKKSLYLAIFFVVVSTLLIVAVSLKRSFNASKNEPELSHHSNDIAIPTSGVQKGIKKPDSNESSSNEGDNQAEKEPVSTQAKKPTAAVKPDELEKKAPVKKAVFSKFVKPVEGKIVQAFSNNELVLSKTLGEYRTHNGVDIEALPQTPVKSVCDGVVVDLFNDTGRWGTCVEIKHNSGVVFVYRGLSSENLNVKLDSRVKAGEIIGVVGQTNVFESALGSHLHLEAKKGDDFVDPLKYIKQ